MGNKVSLTDDSLPLLVREIAQPPKQLFVQGSDLDELLNFPRVAIVGSRKVTPYGRAVTRQFASELARRGVVIISGLAIGVDAIAHQATLDAGGRTIAVLPTSLDSLYPRSHTQLANKIYKQGGALVSEHEHATQAFKGNFVARNRLIAALADVVLVTEAAMSSGSLHTARFAQEQNKPLFAIPGPITSRTSDGTNQLIQTGKAQVALSPQDILECLKINNSVDKPAIKGSTEAEQTILDLLGQNTTDSGELLAQSGLSVTDFNQALTMLEIKGVVHSSGNNSWHIA